MNTNPLSSSPFPVRGFIRGYLEQTGAGEVVLKTSQGVYRVKLEGEIALREGEIVFRVLREEPGLLVLTPYRIETLTEALPFFKALFANEEELGRKLLMAAVQENLPLTREVLAGLKRGLITAERQWGVQVHPRALAFLQARAIPLTPRSLLWALYTLFPAVQKVMWQKAGTGGKLLPDPVVQKGEGSGETGRSGEEGRSVVQGKVLANALKEAVAFLHQRAGREPTLPHFVFYLFPTTQTEVYWIGRKFPAAEPTGAEQDGKGEGEGFGFCLEYQSTFFGRLQITGVGNQLGLSLTIGAERAVLDQNLLRDLGPYLTKKGWPVRSVEFYERQGEKGEEFPPAFRPLRIDGWL